MFTGRVVGSIVVSIPACHAGDRGSIPRRGVHFILRSRSMYVTTLHLFIRSLLNHVVAET